MPAWDTWNPFNSSQNMWHIPGEVDPPKEKPKKPKKPKKKQ